LIRVDRKIFKLEMRMKKENRNWVALLVLLFHVLKFIVLLLYTSL
jgi:hypothetical protein